VITDTGANGARERGEGKITRLKMEALKEARL
jgi:hypothetical protein